MSLGIIVGALLLLKHDLPFAESTMYVAIVAIFLSMFFPLGGYILDWKNRRDKKKKQ